MIVNFRTVSGKVYSLELDPNETIGDVKKRLEEQEGIPSQGCKMILTASILPDEKKIGDLKINPGAFIVIHSQKPKPVVKPVDPTPVEPVKPIEPIKPIDPVINQPEPPKPIDPIDSQPKRPVSPIISKPSNSDPQNFANLCSQLTDMGFDLSSVQKSLRQTNYRSDLAANLLLSGNIPDDEPESFLDDERPNTPPMNFENNFPSRPSFKRFGEMQSQYDSLNSNEKASVDRLLGLGFDPLTTLQVFIACDKDENQTSSCIAGML